MLAASTTEMTLRMLVSLAFVGALLLVVTRVARSRLRIGSRSGLGVLARLQLTRSSSVAVVQAGQRTLLLGVNDHGVTLLAEGVDLVDPGSDDPTPPSDVIDVRPEAAADETDVSRRQLLTAVTGRTRTRPGRTVVPANPSRMNVLEALREKTVRRG